MYVHTTQKKIVSECFFLREICYFRMTRFLKLVSVAGLYERNDLIQHKCLEGWCVLRWAEWRQWAEGGCERHDVAE